MNLAIVRLKKQHEAAIRKGYPWVYEGQLVDSSEYLHFQPGELVALQTIRGEPLGVGIFNAKAAIQFRMLSARSEPIDQAFFVALLKKALTKREKLYDQPYYRLVHSEADGLSGLVIDRFDDVCVAQVSAAGMERLAPLWQGALKELLNSKTLVLRNDIPSRVYEGLAQEVKVIGAPISGLVEAHENGCIYLADVLRGQKTGWFYDMRDNRLRLAKLAVGKTMLDSFSHSGGFGLLAAKMGAKHVTMVDSSALALDIANQAAALNALQAGYECIKSDAVGFMLAQAKKGVSYDVVIADPPAYVKSKKDIHSGMRGYEKVAKAASALVAEGGILFIASCSHHATMSAFRQAALAGIKAAGKQATILSEVGASADHAVHPQLPQNTYLKGLIIKINCASTKIA